MAIIARDAGGKDFEPAPEGTHLAICCDVVDLGMVESEWGQKHMVQIRWQLGGEDAGVRDDGKPWLVTKRFTLSLHEKSVLRPFLEAWRGKRFTQVELDGFDMERLLNVCCQLQVMHAERNGKVYANVHAVMPYPKGAERLEVIDYVRAIDRKEGHSDDAPTPDF